LLGVIEIVFIQYYILIIIYIIIYIIIKISMNRNFKMLMSEVEKWKSGKVPADFA